MNADRTNPGPDLDLVQQQPLPWDATEVNIQFHDGSTFTGRVRRAPGDLLRVDHDTLAVPAGTAVDLQWTQDDRGCYAAGAVVEVYPGSGLVIRVDDSAGGVERRLDVRLPIHLPAVVVSPSGQLFPGRTANLSLRGARLILNRSRSGEEIRYDLGTAGITDESPVTVALTLPTGIVRLNCSITVTDRAPGEVRVRFVHECQLVFEQIGALLRAEEHRIAPHLTRVPPAGAGATR